MSVKITYSGKDRKRIVDDLPEALSLLRSRWPRLVTDGGQSLAGRGVIPDRILVWSDEASSVNDDGSRAVAHITSV